MKSLTPSQISQWLAQEDERLPGVKPLLLDVREPWEFQTASIRADDRFELLQMPMRSVPARLDELDQDRPIACLCHHGGRSAQVVHFLIQQGFANVVNVDGGIHAWALECDPSVPTY